MANYSQYSPWTDAAAYGRGLGDTLSEAMLKMPMQRATLAQQAAMEQTRQREEAQKLAQTEAYHIASLGLGRDKLEEIRRQNAAHQLEMELKSKGNWTPYQNKTTGEVSLYNPVTGETKPYNAPTTTGAPGTGLGAPAAGGGNPPFRLITPPTGGQDLDAILGAIRLKAAAIEKGWPTNNVPGWESVTNVTDPVIKYAQRGLNIDQPAATPPTVAPTNAIPSLGLTNAPASAMMPGAASVKTYNPATGRIE